MQVLGLQLDPPFVRAAKLLWKGTEVKELSWATDPIDKMENVKQLYIHEFPGKIVSGLPSGDLLIRFLEVPRAGSKHLEEIISFQSEATSHFNPADILSVPSFIRGDKNKVETILFTAPRVAIHNHLLAWQQHGVDPDLVSATPLALIQYAQWKIGPMVSAFLIDLGSSEWSCVWMENGQLKKSHSIGGGVEALLATFWEDRKRVLLQKEVGHFAKQCDLLQLKPHVAPHFSTRLEEKRQLLAKNICSFYKLSGAKRPILFTGQVDTLVHLREYLMEEIQDWVSEGIDVPVEEGKHAVAIGLALGKEKEPLQFRREEFFPQKNWRKAGVYAVAAAAIVTLLSCALLTFGNHLLHGQKETMMHTLCTYLEQENPSLKQTIFSHKGTEEEILMRWNRAIAANKKEYPFILQAPKVSETLAWLTSHPLLNGETDPSTLVSMHYQLVQFPTLEALGEPYQAKLEVELQIPNPTQARKLHEALLQDTTWVRTDEAIEWDALNDHTYRASFYLQNRGVNAS